MSRRTVLVTGSSGRLGAPLVQALALEHEVAQLDIRPPEDPAQQGIGRWRKPVVALRPSMIVAVGREPGAERVTEPGKPPEFRAQPAPERPYLFEYIGSNDLISAIRLALEYDPPEGFEAFLVNAADQYSTTPTLDLAAKYFPGVPVDRAKLSRCGGYGAFVDCSRAEDALGWRPGFRCKRDLTDSSPPTIEKGTG